MSNKKSLYLVPKKLDAPTRLLGLPLDEFIPASFFLVFFACLDKVILSFLIPVVIVVLIRIVKNGQGSGWIVNLCYWYFPSWVISGVLRKTPPSACREYIA